MGEYFDGAAVYAVHRHESGRWSVWAYEPSGRRVCRIAVIDEPNWSREAESVKVAKVAKVVKVERDACIHRVHALAVKL
jgi:hypothetical protein